VENERETIPPREVLGNNRRQTAQGPSRTRARHLSRANPSARNEV